MIVAAAYRLERGLILSLPAPHHHADIRFNLSAVFWSEVGSDATKGFLLNCGRFVSQQEALIHAFAAGQIVMGSNDTRTLLNDHDLWPRANAVLKPDSSSSPRPV